MPYVLRNRHVATSASTNIRRQRRGASTAPNSNQTTGSSPTQRSQSWTSLSPGPPVLTANQPNQSNTGSPTSGHNSNNNNSGQSTNNVPIALLANQMNTMNDLLRQLITLNTSQNNSQTNSSSTVPSQPPVITIPEPTVQPQQAANSNSNFGAKKVCNSFGGSSSTLNVDKWLALYESQTLDFPEMRVKWLPKHLVEEAIEWLTVELLPNMQTITWTECKEKMTERFGHHSEDRLIEAGKRVLKRNETVTDYYHDMRRILQTTGVSANTQISFLTNGMPHSFRDHIIASKPKTPSEWLSIAIALEKNRGLAPFRARDSAQFSRHTDRKPDKEFERKQLDYSQPPPTPCPRCLRDHGVRAYHWKRDCNRPTRDFSSHTKTIRGGARESKNFMQQSNKPKTSETEPKDRQVNVISGGQLFYTVTINGNKVRALLDTGATITGMTSETAFRVGLAPDIKKAITIRQVDGRVQTLGQIETNVTLNGITKKLTIHVFRHLDHDMLLGIDGAQIFGILDRLKGDLSIQYMTTVEPIIRQLTTINYDSFLSKFKVFATDDKDIGRLRNTQYSIALEPNSKPFFVGLTDTQQPKKTK
jgi:hypothetical protein